MDPVTCTCEHPRPLERGEARDPRYHGHLLGECRECRRPYFGERS